MSWRPAAPGSQLRKWSKDLFSIMSTTTCSMPSEPVGDSAGAAFAAAWLRASVPATANPVEAAMSCRTVRRVSMGTSLTALLTAPPDWRRGDRMTARETGGECHSTAGPGSGWRALLCHNRAGGGPDRSGAGHAGGYRACTPDLRPAWRAVHDRPYRLR